MKSLKYLAVASLLVVSGGGVAVAQPLGFGSLGSSSSPSVPAVTQTATTQSGVTVKYRVENCNGSYRVIGTLSTDRSGYFWVNYTGPVNGVGGGPAEYKKIPLWSAFLEPGYATDEIPLGGAGTVVNSEPASLTFGLDPYGAGGIINLPDNERSVTVPIDTATLQRCS